MNKTEGFLLTRNWRDTRQGIQLELWFCCEHGPLQVIIDGQQSVFFLLVTDRLNVEQLLHNEVGWRIGSVDLRTHNDQPVVALYCQSQRLNQEYQRRLQAHQIPFWEGDIRPADRYLMERFITGGAEILHSGDRLRNRSYQLSDKNLTAASKATSIPSVRNPQLKASKYQPQLRVVSIDIETSMNGKQLYSIGSYDDQQQVVFMIGEEQQHDENFEIQWFASERLCLEAFVNWLATKDPDILIGWNVVQFDCWVLEQLAQRLNLPLTLGRGGQRWHWRKDDSRGRRYLSVPGRVILDGIDLLKTATYQFDSFSLEAVSRSILGQGKLLHGNGRGEEITDLFLHDKISLARYNLMDCQLVWEVFRTTDLINFAVARSRVTGMAMDRSGGSVASFEYAYLPKLHRKGYIAPNLGEMESDILSPGGYVMDSQPGIYRNVLVLDFKSLYPSIIRTFKIDPYGFWYAQHQKLDDRACVPGFHQARFAKQQNLLPDIIENLWQARDQAKNDNNQALSQAIKIIMNSFYGVLGSPGCRFYDPRVCSSITLRGHEIIQLSRDWIEAQGYRVIYGDTDSVFVWVEQIKDTAKVAQVGADLARGLNLWWQQHLAQEFEVDCALEIEFETHFIQFLMPTIRGSEQGSKKRYAGVVQKTSAAGDETLELVFKGLENVRTDWTVLAKDFQYELYRRVFFEEPVEQFILNTLNDLLAGRSDDKLIYRKRLRRKLPEYQKNVPPHVQAARKLELAGIQLTRGDWVEYVMTTSGPYPLQLLRDAGQSPSSVPSINYQLYVDRQLEPVADSILHFIHTSFKAITDRQLGLF